MRATCSPGLPRLPPGLADGLGLIAVGGLLYWQLGIAEGAYLGRRVVVWLYDRFASRYEAVKAYDTGWERDTLAAPVVTFLKRRPGGSNATSPIVLDVATGTGRFAAALLKVAPATAARAARPTAARATAASATARPVARAATAAASASARVPSTWATP